MILNARKASLGIEFLEGDAQALPFSGESFNRVAINFGLLHLPDPSKALGEAYRVLKHGGRLGFTLWAKPEVNPGGKLMNDAIEAHADKSIKLPEGPPYFLYADKNECRRVLASIGFSENSMTFETVCVDWQVPTAGFYFEAEQTAGVRVAALLAQQSADRQAAIRAEVEKRVKGYAKKGGFVIPMAGYVVTAGKE